jgi:hypothetical protein
VALETIVRQSGLHRAGLFCGQKDRAAGPCCGRTPNPRSSTASTCGARRTRRCSATPAVLGREGIRLEPVRAGRLYSANFDCGPLPPGSA